MYYVKLNVAFTCWCVYAKCHTVMQDMFLV